MNTEELMALLDVAERNIRKDFSEKIESLSVIKGEINIHTSHQTEMTPAANNARLANIRALLTPFGVDATDWAG